MKASVFLLAIALFFVFSCANQNEENIEKIAREYYDTYKERKDFEKLIAFYADEVILEDMINADRIVGKEALTQFLDWNNPEFKKLHADALVIHEQLIDKNKVVTRGYFTEFLWRETKFEAMHFVTILTFDKSGKIIKHIDWINYPSNLIDYNKRKNSNDWIAQ